GDRVYLHGGGDLKCVELKSGKTIWSQDCEAPQAIDERGLVCWSNRAVKLLAPDDGRVQWTHEPVLTSVRDVFITDDAVWIGGFKPFDTGRQHTGPAWGAYYAVQRDLRTGEIVKEVAPENPGHHQRCYASKATTRYILGGRRGTEFIDLESGECLWNSWARGVCRYGVMPANGLLYVPPHSCGCYITAKLTGFNAMAAERAMPAEVAPPAVERGPAYERVGEPPQADDWPTYRGNPRRSGATASGVPTELKTKWRVPLGGRLTAPTVANGRVLVAQADRHALVALDAGSGETAWTFLADARIDSPPTVHDGRALFGCRDGRVYSLLDSDGTLAWRCRGARDARLLSAHEQLESPWPVHGSVLVDQNVAYVTAGRSSYLDGGIRLCRLDPKTGAVLSTTDVHSPDPETGRQPPQFNANQMPGSRSDILVADDKFVYLRDVPFSKDGLPREERVPHLFTLTDFLDDSWTHRSYWVFADKPSIATGCSGREKRLIYGRLLVHDDATVWGYGRKNVHWSNEFLDGPYHLFSRGLDAAEPTWSVPVPIQVRAMVRAGDTLFVAGPAAAAVEGTEPATGRQDAQLLAYSADAGTELGRWDLSAPPVFDGMAAARGQLFLALADGSVLCMAGE
ncbi:MAG: hypothetical protein FJ276_05715, partial [Planctomycetes bacterium]|nr:hypothetical protein [Planctomycetota bacterium]